MTHDPPASPPVKSPPRRRGIVRTLVYTSGVLLITVYFVWLVAQMSLHAHGGGAVPDWTFAGVGLGVLAGAAGAVHRPRR